MVTKSGATESKGTNIWEGEPTSACLGFPSGQLDTADIWTVWTLSNVDPEVDWEPALGPDWRLETGD